MPHPSSLQRKPFWAPVGLAAASALAAALVMALLAWLLVTAKPTTIIVVRDAETASDGVAEAAPGAAAAGAEALSPEGRARAELLARMFGDARRKESVDAMYVLPTPATQATALPLARRLGIKPVVVAPEAPRAWARRVLREHRGGRILVVAPADVAHDLAAELSGVADIPPAEFGTIYFVTVPRIGRANLLSVDY
jgi:broad specificity phosphatase PhoE